MLVTVMKDEVAEQQSVTTKHGYRRIPYKTSQGSVPLARSHRTYDCGFCPFLEICDSAE